MAGREKEPDAALVNRALQAGVAALVGMQHSDGSFPLVQREPGMPWQPCDPLFSTLSVVLAVGSLLPQEAVSRAAAYVLGFRRPDGYWNFGPSFQIPPDSDDTACSLLVLLRHGNYRAQPRDPALLRSFWRADGGPFQTWRGEGMWSERGRDDAVVNCNVLLALAELGSPATLEEINGVVRQVQRDTKGARYYCSPTTITYAARRCGLPLDALPTQLVARPRPESGVQPAAQWLAAVRRWDESLITHLVAAQSRDGTWPMEPWLKGKGIVTIWSSPAISTALCVEALQVSLVAATNR